jgi:hypothetical protein
MLAKCLGFCVGSCVREVDLAAHGAPQDRQFVDPKRMQLAAVFDLRIVRDDRGFHGNVPALDAAARRDESSKSMIVGWVRHRAVCLMPQLQSTAYTTDTKAYCAESSAQSGIW